LVAVTSRARFWCVAALVACSCFSCTSSCNDHPPGGDPPTGGNQEHEFASNGMSRRGGARRPSLVPGIPTDRMALGDGFNSATGEAGARCVAFNPDPEQDAAQVFTASGSQGQKVTYRFEELSDLQQLQKNLRVDASVSFGFGVFSTDASYDFISSGRFSKYRNYIYTEVRVENPFQMLRQKVLTPEAVQWAAQGSTEFVQHCGDEFISGRQTGGDMVAVIEFESNSAEEQQATQASISASLALFGSGDANYADAIRQLQSNRRTRVFVIRNGGQGEIPDIGALARAGRTFPCSVAPLTTGSPQAMQGCPPAAPPSPAPGQPTVTSPNPTTPTAPVLISLGGSAYSTVSNLPSSLSFNVVRDQARTLAKLGEWLEKAYTNRGDLQYVFDHSAQFVVDGGREALHAAWRQNENIISELMTAGNNCHDNSMHCTLPDPPDFPTFEAKPAPVPAQPATANPPAPRCDDQWVRGEGGRDFAEIFTVPHDEIGAPPNGRLNLTNQESGRIYQVDYQCTVLAMRVNVFNACNSVGHQTTIVDDGRGFTWSSGPRYSVQFTWQDKFTAKYEKLKTVCH
jgi:hypothetical protein